MSGPVVIFGCGYVGQRLVRPLLEVGKPIIATTTTAAKLPALLALGVDARRIDGPESVRAACEGASAVIYLAPPGDVAIEDQVAVLREACAGVDTFVYGSTTGVYGKVSDRSRWIDEHTPVSAGVATPRGAMRADFEARLARSGLPLRVVRIAGIYGPGRTLAARLRRGDFILFEDGPHTSRIHADDLCSLLVAMLRPEAPRLVIGCDDHPAPTLDVARYTSELLGISCPEPLSMAEAKERLSPVAREMRMNGRRCRSLFRDDLIGHLRYPTFKEGVRQSLVEEGLLPAADA